jgi:hypothetical protein
MQVSAFYLNWPVISALAGDDFEERQMAWYQSDKGLPGEIAIDTEDDWSDSSIAWMCAGEILERVIPPGSPWQRWVQEAFCRGEELRNDLGCAYNLDLIAATISPETVREIMAPILQQSLPVSEKELESVLQEERDVFPVKESFEHEMRRWYNIWSKASARDFGIGYHVG